MGGCEKMIFHFFTAPFVLQHICTILKLGALPLSPLEAHLSSIMLPSADAFVCCEIYKDCDR